MHAMGLTDPAKLLAMLAVSGTQGIERERLPFYVYMMKEKELADFRYRCVWVQETGDVHCDHLFDDIEALLEASFVVQSSPVRIGESGKKLLDELDRDVVRGAEATFSVFLNDVGQLDTEGLRRECRALSPKDSQL